MDIHGKVAVITGGTSGIGFAVAERLAIEGAKLVIVGIDGRAGQHAEELLRSKGADALFIGGDVSNESIVGALTTQAVGRYGGIDILVNNAGILGGPRFPESSRRHWLRAIEVNQIGTLHCMQAVIPEMQRRGGGCIVNTASTSGITPNPIDPVYAMTKAGIVNLTRSLGFLRDESNIRVNCVCPALVETPLEENSANAYDEISRASFLGRRAGRTHKPALTPGAVATAILRLISDESLNGVSYKIVVGQPDEIVPAAAPQKL